jgi:hypothetical protein
MHNINFKKLYSKKDRIDMMVSMHSEMASLYSFWSGFLDIISVLSSIMLLSFLFIDNTLITDLGINKNIFRFFIGIITIIITCLSVVASILDLKGKRTNHTQAFNTLVQLKSEWNIFLSNKSAINNNTIKVLNEKTDLLTAQLIPINNSLFNKLKQKHYIKVEISRNISKYPFIPIFIMKIRFILRNIQESRNVDACNNVKVRSERDDEILMKGEGNDT